MARSRPPTLLPLLLPLLGSSCNSATWVGCQDLGPLRQPSRLPAEGELEEEALTLLQQARSKRGETEHNRTKKRRGDDYFASIAKDEGDSLLLHKPPVDEQINYPDISKLSVPLDKINEDLAKKKIPRRLWQTWRDSELPPAYRENSKALQEQNPTFSYQLVTDAAGADFMDEHFPGPIAAAYHALLETDLGAARADLLRYGLLYHHGGVYVDLDAKCESLEAYIEPSDSALLSHEDKPNYGRWVQWVVISEPKHPLLLRALKVAVKRLRSGFPKDTESMHEAVVWTTGPGAWSQAVKQFSADLFHNKIDKASSGRFGARVIGQPSSFAKGAMFRPFCEEHAVRVNDVRRYDSLPLPNDRLLVDFEEEPGD